MRVLCWLVVLLCLSCRAAPPPVLELAENLRTVLAEADDAYYNRGKPIMGDAAYDALRDQYQELLKQYPELGSGDAVGASPPDDASKIEHATPVLSLKKALSDEEVMDFISRCGESRRYSVEPKIDGVSLVLRYHQGKLVSAATRGDGRTGVNVTVPVSISRAVPLRLKEEETLEVRGELYLPFSSFEALNRRRLEDGQPALKSMRASTAGSLRLKDFDELARRGLAFRVFALREAESMPDSHAEALAFVRSMGLETVCSRTVPAAEVGPAVEELNRLRADLPYATDGLVIRLAHCAAFEALGATARHPRGAIARKYRPTPVETRLLSVEWSRGPTGRLTPVACFEPVEMEGAVVQRASLYSRRHLQALDLRIGDWIEVVRAGGAVPQITGVDKARRTGDEKPVPAPPAG